MTDSQTLLAEYVATGSETAFRELVSRYLDLVYSAAVRLMDGDAHLAEDVVQTVFTDLARSARTLSKQVMLGGWLHRHTCFVAANFRRTERRRRNRERQAVEMNALPDHSEANLAQVAPVLDDAINQLDETDRAAILLRFFEQRDFRAIGHALGGSEDAAQKRVTRALEKLQRLLKRRGIAFSAVGLGAALSSQAITAAPVGLALTISTTAVATAAAGGATAFTLIQVLAMTKLKALIVGGLIVAGVAAPLILHRESKWREQTQTLQQQVDRLSSENARLTQQVAARPAAAVHTDEAEAAGVHKAAPPAAPTIAVDTAANANASGGSTNKNGGTNGADTSVLGELSSPEMRRLIRENQKGTMNAVYARLTKQLNLTPEQSDRLMNILADDVMDNVDRITKVLREGKSTDQMRSEFAEQDAALQEKVKAALGDDAYVQFQNYTHNLLSLLTTEQFNDGVPKEQKLSDAQVKELQAVIQEEMRSAISRAGLALDYQAVPMLNFQNIASEDSMNASLALLEEIYNSVNARIGSLLSEDQMKKFREFQSNAINLSRAGIVINRKMMAPSLAK